MRLWRWLGQLRCGRDGSSDALRNQLPEQLIFRPQSGHFSFQPVGFWSGRRLAVAANICDQKKQED